MTTNAPPEVWLRGPVAGIPALLQPVAHCLLQSREEIAAKVANLTADQIWATPAGAPSIAFHVRHAGASLDRLFTYARGERLSADQKAGFAAEGQPDPRPDIAAALVAEFQAHVDRALAQLGSTDEATLVEFRGVGRAQMPSTVLGLLFHGAEHTQRHTGQIVTTARIVSGAV